MIKEKKKSNKYNFKKSKRQVFIEYVRTITCSILFAVIFTTCLAIHARNEMIKNIYTGIEEQKTLDKQMALQLIQQSTFLNDLQHQKYSVCLHSGELYETAGDLFHAQAAYEHAVQKAKPGIYKPYYKLACVLIAQEKFEQAEALLNNIKDFTNKDLIKFKTRTYIVMGDKYYSIGKFISAAKSYEKADFYYSKFSKKDKVVDESIKNRIKNAYIQAADVIVKMGHNSEAVRLLHKAEEYAPDDFQIRYKLAIILSDSDPEKSVDYLEPLLDEMPQSIDYSVYGNALMKAANIADLDGRPTKAKYYRYKIHSIDMFINRKVIYKNDIETTLKSFVIKKSWFTYPLKAEFSFLNISNVDIINLFADFVLTDNDKPIETISTQISNKKTPLYSNGYEPVSKIVKFKKHVFTKKELENYAVEIYLYKDEKFKTLAAKIRVPQHTVNYIQ